LASEPFSVAASGSKDLTVMVYQVVRGFVSHASFSSANDFVSGKRIQMLASCGIAQVVDSALVSLAHINESFPLKSISPQIYEQLLRQFPFAKKLQSKTIIRKKLLIKCWWNWHLDMASRWILSSIVDHISVSDVDRPVSVETSDAFEFNQITRFSTVEMNIMMNQYYIMRKFSKGTVYTRV